MAGSRRPTGRGAFHLAILAAIAMLSGCLAPPTASNPEPGSFTDHAGWTEYYPAWLTGPATLSYHGKELRIASNQSYAIGADFLYVTEAGAREPAAANACRAGERQAAGIWVLLSASGCIWTPHPGVACVGAEACDEVAK